MLDDTLKAQLQAYLEKVTLPFEIVASVDDSAKSAELLALLNDIISLSDKITLRTDGNDARKPSFSLNRPNGNISLRFAGLPIDNVFSKGNILIHSAKRLESVGSDHLPVLIEFSTKPGTDQQEDENETATVSAEQLRG